MVVLFQESVEGVIKPYNPSVHMEGAENREGVTCYLDALLFSMFARLGSFEPILYTIFDDEPRRRLSTLIRLWVNMLRTGKLIQTDVVRISQPYTSLFLTHTIDLLLARSTGGVWLERCSRARAAGHIGGFQFYHRETPIATADPENGHISYRH